MRFALLTDGAEPMFVAACYEMESGVYFTNQAEDACSYATIGKAKAAAELIGGVLGFSPVIVAVDY